MSEWNSSTSNFSDSGSSAKQSEEFAGSLFWKSHGHFMMVNFSIKSTAGDQSFSSFL